MTAPATSRRRWSSTRESAPLLAQATAKGHRIGAADEFNFDYGLECILDHADTLDSKRPVEEEARARSAQRK